MDGDKLAILSRDELLEMALDLQGQVSLQEQELASHKSAMDTQIRTITNQETVIAKHQKELVNSVQTIDKQKERIAELMGFLAESQKQQYGAKSERYQADNQLSLFGDLEEAIELGKKELEKEEVTYTRNKPRPEKPFRKPLPEDLPRIEIILEPNQDRTGLIRIGEEITEELHITPAKITVRRYIRYKYIDPKDESKGVIIADLPSRPINKGIAGASLLSWILVSKFVDHQPLYRQQQIFDRIGYPIPRSTIEGWTRQSTDLISPLYQKHKELVLSTDYLQADESPIKVLDRNKPKNICQGYHWVYHDPVRRLCLFDYRPNRSKAGPVAILSNFQGYLQTDGYTAYEAFEKRQGIKLVSCLAHIRRYFIKAHEAGESAASEVLDMIQALYAVEREAREKKLSHAQRFELRQEKSAPILDKIGQWVVTQQQLSRFLPKSLMGKAHYYLIGRYNYICRILKDGRLEIDNNLIENKIRPLALGRKNYLFAGSHEGGKRGAMMYSFFQTCKMHDVNPQEWLTDVLTRIKETKTSKLETLLPHNWKQSHKNNT